MSHGEIFVRTTQKPASHETVIVVMAMGGVLLVLFNFEELFTCKQVQPGLRDLLKTTKENPTKNWAKNVSRLNYASLVLVIYMRNRNWPSLSPSVQDSC